LPVRGAVSEEETMTNEKLQQDKRHGMDWEFVGQNIYSTDTDLIRITIERKDLPSKARREAEQCPGPSAM
jgi:argininosuccinate synthase